MRPPTQPPSAAPRRDLATVAACAAAVAGLGFTMWLGVREDRPAARGGQARAASTKEETAAAPSTQHGDVGASTGRPGGSERAGHERPPGWIPDRAREATEVVALDEDPENDPLCKHAESVLGLGKAIAVSLEREVREATRVSDEDESAIGDRIEAALPRQRSFSGRWDVPEDVRRYGAYAGGLVRHLARRGTRAGIRYRVHLVRRDEFNASALPGGVLLVFTGMLEGGEAVRSEAELVAVLGHEIAHVEKRHTMAAYQYAKVMLGEDADDGMLAMKVLTMPLSTEYELEADDRGLELAVEGQYNPQAAVDLWRRRAAPGERPSGGLLGEIIDEVGYVIRSHPPAAKRACRAMNRVLWARDHAPWGRLYDGRTNLKARVIGPEKAF